MDMFEICEECGEWIEDDDLVCPHCNCHEDCCQCEDIDQEEDLVVYGDCLMCEQVPCQCSVFGGSFWDEMFSKFAIREVVEANGGYGKHRRD